ncbi:MAG: hypothetical protein LBQ94_08355 [Treponema sp.]|jgi:hypothetical protein|nr:hypothetical protein [Treponema sp.]
MRTLRIFALISAVFLIACDGLDQFIADLTPTTPQDMPPFVITKPVMEISERPYQYNYAGIAFKLLNKSGENIDRITVSFMLFDAKTQASPFIGNNRFEIAKSDMVYPGENKQIFISLDLYIYTAPTEPYLIDFFYISEIRYTNGGIWEDKNGKYRVRFL